MVNHLLIKKKENCKIKLWSRWSLKTSTSNIWSYCGCCALKISLTCVFLSLDCIWNLVKWSRTNLNIFCIMHSLFLPCCFVQFRLVIESPEDLNQTKKLLQELSSVVPSRNLAECGHQDDGRSGFLELDGYVGMLVFKKKKKKRSPAMWSVWKLSVKQPCGIIIRTPAGK